MFTVHVATLMPMEMSRYAREVVKEEKEKKNASIIGEGRKSDEDGEIEIEMMLVGVGKDAKERELSDDSEEKEVSVDGWDAASQTEGVEGGSSTNSMTFAFKYRIKRSDKDKDDAVLVKAINLEQVLVVSALVSGSNDPIVMELDINEFTNDKQDQDVMDGYRDLDELCEKLAFFISEVLGCKFIASKKKETAANGESIDPVARRKYQEEEEMIGYDIDVGPTMVQRPSPHVDPLRVPHMRPGGHVGVTGLPDPLAVGNHDLDPFAPSMIGIPAPQSGRHPFDLQPQPGNFVGPDHPLFHGGGGLGGYPPRRGVEYPPGVPPGARYV